MDKLTAIFNNYTQNKNRKHLGAFSLYAGDGGTVFCFFVASAIQQKNLLKQIVSSFFTTSGSVLVSYVYKGIDGVKIMY